MITLTDFTNFIKSFQMTLNLKHRSDNLETKTKYTKTKTQCYVARISLVCKFLRFIRHKLFKNKINSVTNYQILYFFCKFILCDLISHEILSCDLHRT